MPDDAEPLIPGHEIGPPETPPLRRDAQRNRQLVLEAAREVFARHGLGASLDDIARHAGVGVGTVYRRFPDKEALIEDLFEVSVGQIIDVVEHALTLPSGWDGMVHFLHRVSALQAGDRGLRETALSTGYGRSRVAALRARVDLGLRRLVARAKAEGTLRAEITANDVPLVLFMVGNVAQNARGIRPDLTRRYLDLIIDGMRNRADGTRLDDPVDDAELERFMQGWGPTPRRASPPKPDRGPRTG